MEFKTFAEELAQFYAKEVECVESEMPCKAASTDAERSLSGIQLSRSCPNSIFPQDGSLMISGSKVFFDWLAEQIPWDAEDPTSGLPFHVHIDKFWPGTFISDNSWDFIITKLPFE